MTVHSDPIESHEIHRDRLLAHAEERLAAGDRLQASEKIWGAVAHAVKAIASERGWRFDRHRDLKRTVRHIAAQVGDQEINTLFRSAESFHSNFYNDTYALDEFREGVAEARRLIRLLREANAAMGPNAPPPQGISAQAPQGSA